MPINRDHMRIYKCTGRKFYAHVPIQHTLTHFDLVIQQQYANNIDHIYVRMPLWECVADCTIDFVIYVHAFHVHIRRLKFEYELMCKINYKI